MRPEILSLLLVTLNAALSLKRLLKTRQRSGSLAWEFSRRRRGRGSDWGRVVRRMTLEYERWADLLAPLGEFGRFTDRFDLIRDLLSRPFCERFCFAFSFVLMSDAFPSTREGLGEGSVA